MAVVVREVKASSGLSVISGNRFVIDAPDRIGISDCSRCVVLGRFGNIRRREETVAATPRRPDSGCRAFTATFVEVTSRQANRSCHCASQSDRKGGGRPGAWLVWLATGLGVAGEELWCVHFGRGLRTERLLTYRQILSASCFFGHM